MGDEALGAIEHVLVAVAPGAHAVRGDIAACGRLGQGEGGQPLARGQSGKVPVLLLVRSGEEDRQGAQLLDDRDEARGRIGAGDLLDEDGLRHRVERRAAVALLEAGAEKVGLGQQLLEVPRELAGRVDLGGARSDAFFRQLAHHGTQLVVIGGREVRHAAPRGQVRCRMGARAVRV
jgi:hypothetical protein